MTQRKKKQAKHEGLTSTQVATKNNPVETAEVKIISSNADEPKLFEGKKMYWAKTMHFQILGIVEGVVLNKHWDLFIEKAPENIDFYKWISSTDVKAERIARVKSKMKAKIGLTE
tara:strand:+ start:12410 stop:12754 length:345 start_codon:yes stop_codon:yes gene_type:complete